MADALIDTNVFMYAAGGEHPYREPCRRVVSGLQTGRVGPHRAVLDAELFQELAYRFVSIGRASVGLELQRNVLALSLPVLAVDAEVVSTFVRHQQTYAAELAARSVSVRDVLHLAAATRHGVGVVVTADRDFDRFREIVRLDPRALAP